RCRAVVERPGLTAARYTGVNFSIDTLGIDMAATEAPEHERSLSSTLMVRLRQHDPDAWRRMTELFGPLAYHWCRRAGLSPADAADVVQDVFHSVAVGLPRFRRDRPGDSYRAWIATIARNRIRDHFRRIDGQPQGRGGADFQEQVLNLPDPEADDSLDGASHASDESRSVLHRALQLVRAEFEDRTWRAFWRTTVEQQAPADVAADLGVSPNAVYKAKSRVLRRLRNELDGFLD
ncbi:MAG: sigma-70 family RNA polymerase sigma factor, partial [Planctomycetota bacterium]